MSLEQQLEGDLKAIVAEAKRKHPTLSAAADQALTSLRQPTLSVSALMLPLQRVPSPPTPKLAQLSLVFVNRLVTNELVDSVNCDVLLQGLQALAESGDEIVQVKILQVLMLLLNPRTVILTEGLVTRVTALTMTLRRSRSLMVHNTASACMKHLIRLTFDKLAVWAAQARDPPEVLSAASFAKLSHEAQAIYECAGKLLTSIVEMTADSDKTVSAEGLDLLASIVADCRDWLGQLPEYMRQVEGLCARVFPGLYAETDPALQRKFITCVVQMAEITVAVFPCLGKLLEIIDSGHVSDVQVLQIIDDLPILCQNSLSLKRVFLYEHGTLYTQLLYVVCKVCNQALTHFDRKRSVKTQEEIGKGAVHILSTVVKSIYKLAEAAQIHPDKILTKPLNPEQKVCEDMVSATWKQLLPTLTVILNCPLTDEALHLGLNSFQYLIGISGALNLVPARETYINALAGIVGTPELILCQRGVLAAKTILNVALSIGQVLDTKNWKKILETLHKIEHLYQISAPGDDRGQNEFRAFFDELSLVYKNSKGLSDQALVDLVGALGQLTIENMEGLAAVERTRRDSKLFGVYRMVDVAMVNLHRIQLFWDNITGYLDLICNSKHAEAQVAGTKALSTLVVAAFKYLTEFPLTTDLEKWSQWQLHILKTLEEYVKSALPETHSCSFVVISELLESCGDLLQPESWELILTLLAHEHPQSHPVKTHCLQVIMEKFPPGDNMTNCIELLISLISQLLLTPNTLEDDMTTFDALSAYAKVAEWIKISNSPQDTWLLLFEDLKMLAEEGNPELRTAALQVMSEVLTGQAQVLTSETWVKIVGDIILVSLQKISTSYLQHAVREEEVPVLELPKFGAAQTEVHVPKKGKKSLQISIPSDSAVPLVKETPKFAGSTEPHFKSDKGVTSYPRTDSLEKQWETTFSTFLVNLGPVFQAYLSQAGYQGEVSNPAPRKHWDLLVLRLKEGIHYGTINVVTHVLSATRDLVSQPCAMELFLAKWRTSWELYSTLCNRLQVSTATISQELMIACLDNFKLIYSQVSEVPEALGEKVLLVLFSILKFFFVGCKNETALLPNCKLCPDEVRVFEFIDWMGDVLSQSAEASRLYLHFLLSLAVYDPSDPHSDALSRGALNSLLVFTTHHPPLTVSILPVILDKFGNLMLLRFSEEAFLSLSISAKGMTPLWVHAAEMLLSLLPIVIKFDCWDSAIHVFELVLNPDSQQLSSLSNVKIDDIVQVCEEIDTRCMEFIAQTLVPASMSQHANMQWRLLSLLDSGCANYYRKVTQIEQSLSAKCLDYLFELSKVRPSTPEEQEKTSISDEPLAIKIAKRASPVLVSRCKELIKQYLADEKAASEDLPSSRIEELIEVLRCLKTLDQPEAEGTRKKSHLVELYPLFTELVGSREEEVRAQLKEIFGEVGKMLESTGK